MAKRIPELEALATQMVGDGGDPNLYFVSTYDPKTGGDGALVGIARSEEIAKGIGGHYDAAVVIEDRKTGVVWENAASERFQREAAEAELYDNPVTSSLNPAKPAKKLKSKLLR